MQSKPIKSLELCWGSIELDYPYALTILLSMGYEREFTYPEYNKLWTIVNTGKLINKDVSQWEEKLTKESERLRKNKKEYEAFAKESEKERKRLDKKIAECDAHIAYLEKEIALLESQQTK